jgi:hypothetical protein
MYANYGITDDRFENAFELVRYNLGQSSEGFKVAGNAVQFSLIVAGLDPHFAKELRE